MRDITYSLQCYFNGTILYHPRNKYPACHSERSGTDIQNQAIKIRTAAESNPAGAPAGGISALTYGFVQSLISNIQQKRNDPCVVPPYSNVTFLPLLPGSGESASVQIPLVGIWLGAAGNSSTATGCIRIRTTNSKGQKFPC